MSAVKYTGILCFILLCSLCTAATELPGDPYIESDAYLIKLVKWERLGPGYDSYKFTFRARNKKSAQESTLVVQNETTSLRSADVIGRVLAVFGEAGGTADVVTLLNIDSGELVDHFLCYWPQLSSEKRYIAYRKFYPRAADPALTSDLVLLYNLQASAAANRAGMDGRTSDEIGIPIFPPENASAHSLRVWVEAPEERNRVYPVSKFLWLKGDSDVLFVNKKGDGNWVVLVDLSGGLDHVVVRQKKIDVGAMLQLDQHAPEYASKITEYNRNLVVREILASRPGYVTLRIDGLGGRVSEFEVPAP